MDIFSDYKKAPGPGTNKKGKTDLNTKSAKGPEQEENAGIKPAPEKASEEDEKETEDSDMTQYQNIDSGKDSSDAERSDNDIEGPDKGTENIFK